MFVVYVHIYLFVKMTAIVFIITYFYHMSITKYCDKLSRPYCSSLKTKMEMDTFSVSRYAELHNFLSINQ